MKIFVTLILIVISFYSFGQIPGKTQLTKTSNIPKYDETTGTRLSEKEFYQMIKENPEMVPKEEIDKYGNITKLTFNPSRSGRVNDRDPELRVKPGEEFLPFVMKTIDGEKLDSEKLKGMRILIHSQLSLNKPMFIEKAFQDVNNLVNEKSESEHLIFILLTESSANEIDKTFLSGYKEMKVVSDAANFSKRYIISSFPTNILIDENGKLVSYYDNTEFEKLKEALKQ